MICWITMFIWVLRIAVVLLRWVLDEKWIVLVSAWWNSERVISENMVKVIDGGWQ